MVELHVTLYSLLYRASEPLALIIYNILHTTALTCNNGSNAFRSDLLIECPFDKQIDS
jgi:hypothetical protein